MKKGVERAVWIIISIVVASVVIAIVAASVYVVFSGYSSASSKKQTSMFSYISSILPHLSTISIPLSLFIPFIFFYLFLHILYPLKEGERRKGMALQKIMYLLLVLIIAAVLATVVLLTYKSLQSRGNVVNPNEERYAIECNVKCRSLVNENPEILTTEECLDVCMQNKGKVSAEMIYLRKNVDGKGEGK